MIISVFSNLNNKGVSVLAVNVVNKLISGGAEVYFIRGTRSCICKNKSEI